MWEGLRWSGWGLRGGIAVRVLMRRESKRLTEIPTAGLKNKQ